MVLLVSLSNFSVVFHGSVSTDESLFFSCSTLQENFVSFSIHLQTQSCCVLFCTMYLFLSFPLNPSYCPCLLCCGFTSCIPYYTCISAMLLTTSALFLSISCLMKYKFLSLTSSLTETCTIVCFSSSFCTVFFPSLAFYLFYFSFHFLPLTFTFSDHCSPCSAPFSPTGICQNVFHA